MVHDGNKCEACAKKRAVFKTTRDDASYRGEKKLCSPCTAAKVTKYPLTIKRLYG